MTEIDYGALTSVDWLETAKQIENFWHSLGFYQVRVEVVDTTPAAATLYGKGILRSNLVNGLPPGSDGKQVHNARVRE